MAGGSEWMEGERWSSSVGYRRVSTEMESHSPAFDSCSSIVDYFKVTSAFLLPIPGNPMLLIHYIPEEAV